MKGMSGGRSPRLVETAPDDPSSEGYAVLTERRRKPAGISDERPDWRGTGDFHGEHTGVKRDVDVVQLSEELLFVIDGEDRFLEVDIIRIGSHSGDSSVRYYTESASNVHGPSNSKYQHAEGVVSFSPNEPIKTVRIGIKEGQMSDVMVEFKVCLAEPVGCVLGQSLHTARVKVVDKHTFPSNKYRAQLEGRADADGDILSHEAQQALFAAVPWGGLLREYIRRQMSVPGTKWRTLTTFALDQFNNVNFLTRCYLSMIMIDIILREAYSANNERFDELFLESFFASPTPREGAKRIVVFYAVIYFMLLGADVVKAKMDMQGLGREYLQNNLFRKYLNYDEASRAKIWPSSMCLCLLKDTEDVVDNAFLKILAMVRVIGMIVLTSIFVVLQQPELLGATIVFPVVTMFLVYFQIRVFVDLGEALTQQEEDVTHLVEETCRCYPLLRDYHQKTRLADKYQDKTAELSRRKVRVQQSVLYLGNFFPAIATVMTCVYILHFYEDVISGSLSLGKFIAMIQIFFMFGDEFKDVFTDIMEIVGSIGSLEKVTVYMNGKTDLLPRALAGKDRRKEMHARINGQNIYNASQKEGVVDAIDQVPITFKDIVFSYGHPVHNWSLRLPFLEIQQGTITAVVSDHMHGKHTFMKLLAGLHYSQQGHLFVPTHLKVLNVSEEPVILENGLLENVMFGMQIPGCSGHDSQPEARAQRIIDKLGLQVLKETLREEMRTRATDLTWSHRLSPSELSLVHLARALIANPEILILHMPLKNYSGEMANTVMAVVADHVAERGVEVTDPRFPKERRRPRTVFFAANTSDGASRWAHKVVEIRAGQATVSDGNLGTTMGRFTNRARTDVEAAEHMVADAIIGRQPASNTNIPDFEKPASNNRSCEQWSLMDCSPLRR